MAVASLVTGILLHQVGDVPPWGEFIVVSVIAIVVARSAAERQSLYGLPVLLDPLAGLPRVALCAASGALAAIVTLLLLHEPLPGLPYLITQPMAWALASGAGLLAFRSAVAGRLQAQARAGRLSNRVALIGANATSLRVIHESARDPKIRILGIYDDRATRLSETATQTWLRGNVDDLILSARKQAVDTVIIALPLGATDRIAAIRAKLAGIATDVFLATDIDTVSLAGAHFTTVGSSSVLAVAERPLKDWPAFKKAAFDRVAGVVFLVLALPLMGAIAAAVRLNSAGPAFFRQEREGLNGVPFTMLKFRTMYERTHDESVQATVNDRRVTAVGYWLRRLSLDELPQLFNVVRGDMSLVGPRPHMATTRAGNRLFHEIVPHYQSRHRMKPGLTGWAQVQGLRGETRTERDIAERVAHDLYYIDNWSLGLDLKIIAKTISSEIFSSSGRAY